MNIIMTLVWAFLGCGFSLIFISAIYYLYNNDTNTLTRIIFIILISALGMLSFLFFKLAVIA